MILFDDRPIQDRSDDPQLTAAARAVLEVEPKDKIERSRSQTTN
jgi:hypothetical protein